MSFLGSGQAYDTFMGRWSRPLAPLFADAAAVPAAGDRPATALDVGCGPGALTEVLVDRLGAPRVAAVDPSPPFVADCAARLPGVDVQVAGAEELPFGDASFDAVLAQLVLHFVGDPERAMAEFRRVLRPGGVAGACVWDFAEGMEMLRRFWDSALVIDPAAPDEAQVMRFGRPGELTALLTAAGFGAVTETTLQVSSRYAGFDELWAGYEAGIGPAGSYLTGLDPDRRAALREDLFRRLGSPADGFALTAVARAVGRAPELTRP